MIQTVLALGAAFYLAALGVIPPEVQCVPPVSPKPNIESSSKLGSMTITPEVSKEAKDNTITISVFSDVEGRAITLARPILNKKGGSSTFHKEELIDWGPKNLPQGASFGHKQFSDVFQWEAHDIEVPGGVFSKPKMKRVRLPPRQKYWIKLKATGKTISSASDQNFGNYGWQAVDYDITDDRETSGGRRLYYIGGIQQPVLKFARVGSYKEEFYRERAVTVKAGEAFDLEVKATGQGGMARIETTGPRVAGEKEVAIKSGGTHVWKIVPHGTYPIEIETSIRNKCGSQIAGIGRIKIPIKFDLSVLAKEKVRLLFGAFNALTFGKPESVLDLSLSLTVRDGDIIVTGVPNVPFTVQAVYKNSPDEIIKNILIAAKGKFPEAGLATLVTDKDGAIKISVTAPKLTKEEASRDIIMFKARALTLPGLVAETKLPIEGVSTNVISSVAKLVIAPDRSLEGIKEGDKVNFKASLRMSDGSMRQTKDVKWTLIGPVGEINSQGVYKAVLSDEIAELGEGIGAVMASYKDPSGKEYQTKTELFKVEAFVSEGEVDETQG